MKYNIDDFKYDTILSHWYLEVEKGIVFIKPEAYFNVNHTYFVSVRFHGVIVRDYHNEYSLKEAIVYCNSLIKIYNDNFINQGNRNLDENQGQENPREFISIGEIRT